VLIFDCMVKPLRVFSMVFDFSHAEFFRYNVSGDLYIACVVALSAYQ
jgi:hypothetical protein